MMSWAGEEPFIQDKLTFPPTRLHSKLSRSPGWQHTLEYWNWSNKYLGLLLQNIKPKIFLFGMFYQEQTGPIGLILNMATLSHLYGVFTSHFFLWMMISPRNLHQIWNSMTDLESWFNSAFENDIGHWIWWKLKVFLKVFKLFFKISKYIFKLPKKEV